MRTKKKKVYCKHCLYYGQMIGVAKDILKYSTSGLPVLGCLKHNMRLSDDDLPNSKLDCSDHSETKNLQQVWKMSIRHDR